jgi:hypothetical protein
MTDTAVQSSPFLAPSRCMAIRTTRPIRATWHCRHYSYEPGPGGGPRCALGADQSAGVQPCMPKPRGECPKREEYTDAERAAWEAETKASLKRVGNAVGALPHPIPLRSTGKVQCPNCGGQLHYSRWERGAAVECETPHCVGPVRFNIAAGADWPS